MARRPGSGAVVVNLEGTLMTVTGRFRNGVIEPGRPLALREGEVVEIVVRESAAVDEEARAAILHWLRTREKGSPQAVEEWRESMREVERLREEDVEAQRREWEDEERGSPPDGDGTGARE